MTGVWTISNVLLLWKCLNVFYSALKDFQNFNLSNIFELAIQNGQNDSFRYVMNRICIISNNWNIDSATF